MTTAEHTPPSAGQHRAPLDAAHDPTSLHHHKQVFHGFVRFMTWSAIVSILVLIFVALVNA